MGPLPVFPALALLSQRLIYIAIITLTGVSLAYLFSGSATIFVIVGIMFSLNALFIFYLNISSGLFRPLIFMAVSGIHRCDSCQ
ncbi:membrane protein [Salmonella enterica subsp. enterica]|uniref:Membrane protein n=1 Tax=Salmonella enterica I TaxID=59201 RepID=A0A379VUA6_SALET|nr:membrane protein [Salmonella enterica subsp. enterica]